MSGRMILCSAHVWTGVIKNTRERKHGGGGVLSP